MQLSKKSVDACTTSRKKYSAVKRNHVLTCYLMLAVPIIGFLVFSLYPILWALRYTLFDYDGVDAYFVGVANFVRVFTRDPAYWSSLETTFLLTFGKLAIELPLALILALVLNNALKGKGILRAIYFLPNIISVAIIGIIFYFIFDTADGVMNNWLMSLHLIGKPINWFGNKWFALFVIALASIWQGFGMNMLFFLSGVQGIPRELYESASLDGANKWQSFWRVTLPMLAPVIQVVFMLAMIGTMQTTDLVLVLTNGQPAGQTEVVMTYIFKYFFNYGSDISPQYGYATSMSVVTAVILGIFTMIYFRMTNKKTQIY